VSVSVSLSLRVSVGTMQGVGDAELFAVLLRLDAAALGRAACVCVRWRKAAREGPLWERHCRSAKEFFGRGEGGGEGRGDGGVLRGSAEGGRERAEGVVPRDWWAVWREAPRLRDDGVYVQRSWYMRRGLRDPGHPVPPSFRVVYHRYIRFFRDGTCWMVTSPESPYDVIRQLSGHHVAAARAAAAAARRRAGGSRRGEADAAAHDASKESIRQGDWVLEGAALSVTVELGTQFLFLGFVLGQGGKPGSWNRLHPTDASDPAAAAAAATSAPGQRRPWNRRDHGSHQYNESGPYCFFPIDGIDSPYPKPRVAPKPRPSGDGGESAHRHEHVRPATAAGDRASCSHAGESDLAKSAAHES